MKNKILSLVLALLMAASSASAVLADDVALIDETAEEVAVVEEVEDGQYNKAIEFLANYGIMKGITDNDFGAELDVQRYQMALFVARISTGRVNDHEWLNASEDWSGFTDISEGPAANYWGALSYASQAGIIEGYGDGKFGPTDGITYQNALTMVVRTLGYTGLEWPWGYIQKAVELGLTEGITGVSYTDELTRGEVAQIIYNAMFAKMKDGSNLALKNFGIEFGWEKVVITASDLNTFVADDKDAEKALKNDTTPYFKNSNKPNAGFVTFQLLKNDGSLADDVYYVQASELGLKGDHDDELAVGEAYYVLFEKDEDGLAKVVAYESLKLDTIWNEGKTDDNGDEQDYAIQEFLEDYALVGKYTTNEYLNVTASTKNEMLVYAAANSTLEEKYVKENLVAIDWATGDILVPVDQNDDDKIDEKDQDEKGNYEYTVEWYYNDVTGKYWNYQFDKKYEHVIGIDKMTEKEFSDTYAKYFVYGKNTFDGFCNTVDKIATSAYASLEIFDTDLDGVAERGIYESYRLGYFYESTHKDSKSYRIDKVNAFDLAVKAADVDDSYSVTNIAEFNEIQEGIKDADDTDRAWFVEGYEPNVKYDEDGEAVGYESAYVIYNYDAETGAIKVVKVIDGSDEDSFVESGVLRGYNVANGTVTIGEETYHIDQYDELEGSGFKYVAKSAATKAVYTATLRKYFNQFVNYVVVDGELVHIAPANAGKGGFIVVDSYAGLSKDGAIVVNGYNTTDLEYTQFRIANYNNWYGGDYYYYLTDAKAYESFTKGAIYAISSYDEAEDLYYVQLAGAFDKANNEYTGNYTVVKSAYVTPNSCTITANDEGYAVVTIDGTVERKMSTNDKYVIVTLPAETNPYAPVIVYTGKLGDNWSVSGDIINTTDENAGTYVIVNVDPEDLVGFKDTYDTGLVLLLEDGYYNLGEDEDLLGAYTGSVYAFDALNGGDKKLYSATNKDLDAGRVYYAQQGVLVEDYGFQTLAELVATAQVIYGNETADTAAYGFGAAQITKATYADLFNANADTTIKDEDEVLVYNAIQANDNYTNFFGTKKFYNDLIDDDIKIYAVSYNDKDIITEVKGVDKKGFEKLVDKDAEAFTYNVYFVYNTETKDVVAYIDMVDVTGVKKTVEGECDSIEVWATENEDAKIIADVVYDEVVVDGEVVGQKIKGVEFTYVIDDEDARHALIAEYGWNFDRAGADNNENYKVSYNVWVTTPDGTQVKDIEVLNSIVVDEYTYADCDECDNCALVQKVYVEFEDVVETTITRNADGVITTAQDFVTRIVIDEYNTLNELFDVKLRNIAVDTDEDGKLDTVVFDLVEENIATTKGVKPAN